LRDVFESKVDLETNYREAINFSDSNFNWRQLIAKVGDRIVEINFKKRIEVKVPFFKVLF